MWYQQTSWYLCHLCSPSPNRYCAIPVLKVRKGTEEELTFLEYSYIYSFTNTYLFIFCSVADPGNVLDTKTDEVLGELTFY